MHHVDLNTAPDVVRQVILSFPSSGTVFELDGRPVACLIPPPTKVDEGEEWTATNNDRRFYLIDKEIDGSITPEQALELETLQTRMGRWLDKVAPLPLEYIRQLHRELLEASVPKAVDGTP